MRLGQHITSVGADDETKCEIAPEALASTKVFVDAVSSAMTYGNTYRAISKQLIDEMHLTEVGAVLNNRIDRDPK